MVDGRMVAAINEQDGGAPGAELGWTVEGQVTPPISRELGTTGRGIGACERSRLES